jgi:hypothetical protein
VRLVNLSVSSLGQARFDVGDQDGLPACKHCDSRLVQLHGWKELPNDDVLLHLRCPECLGFTSEGFGHEAMEMFDEALIRWRDALVADYEAIVRHNMEELAMKLRRALEHDLIGADDFGSRREPRGTPSGHWVQSPSQSV